MSDKGLITGEDTHQRCWWCGTDEEYVRYHDTEWGHPVHDDTHLFEKICLEGFQAGLSWLTILRKRENFRASFDDFDFYKVAKYDNDAINLLLQNTGIIRHRGKIEATINNAQRAIELIEEKGSLSDYFWSFQPQNHCAPELKTDILGKTEASTILSKDLKKRGWKFVGPTTCYAFMQAMGMVNDHIKGCHSR
ncbi:MAG: DNA-3-methyladenine glycosylase I [Alphaproteobacteria bacterium]|nr:MAG: DNA-3-methyladenine glycosylase I [Alphaproteobacteria bacterium]